MIYNEELKRSFLYFESLKKQNLLSKSMISKLQFLQSSIKQKNPSLNIIEQLSQIQKLSLKELNRENQIILFNSIIKCQIDNYQDKDIMNIRKAFVKKQELFARWTQCIIDFRPPFVIISKDKLPKESMYTLEITKLSISKHFRQEKKKYIFGIIYEQNKYLVGYKEEKNCKQLHEDILNYIRQTKNKKQSQILHNQLIIQKNQAPIVMSNLQFQKEEAIFDENYRQFNEEVYFQQEQHDYFSKIQQNIFNEFINDKSEYVLVKNIENGRITIDNCNNSYKISIMIRNTNVANTIQKYMDFKVWNKDVQNFKIINQIRKNTFLAYISFKKNNFLDKTRQTYLTVTYLNNCICFLDKQSQKQVSLEKQDKFNNQYLIIKSLPMQEDRSSGNINFYQIVQFSQGAQNHKQFILVTIKSKIQYKGYNLLVNSNKMHMNFFEQISQFTNLCKKKAFNPLFDYDFCFCMKKKRDSNEFMVYHRKSLQYDEQYTQQAQHMNRNFKQNQIIKIIEQTQQKIENKDIIYIIKNKIHEKYYFNHNFKQSYNYSNGQLQKLEQSDYLLQKGLWKIVNNQLIYCNEEAIKLQKDIIKIMLRKAGAYLYKGKSIMNLSLPAQVLDGKSTLQMLADMMGFFPKFIYQAISAKNLIQQMKYVALSLMFATSCFPNIQKPFNPILGQTFQGIIGNIPIYLEQISSNPPISSFLMKNNDFEAYGNFDVNVQMGINSAYSKIPSLFTVKIFKSKTQYLVKIPDLQIGGNLFGDRLLRQFGLGFVYQKVNNVYCEYSIGSDKKKIFQASRIMNVNEIVGGVYKITHTFGKQIEKFKDYKNFQGVTQDNIIEKYSKITGNWFGDLSFDGKQYKSFKKGPFPLKVKRQPYLLPSDSIFRLDIIYKFWKQLQKADLQKQILEKMQRKDSQLRRKN